MNLGEHKYFGLRKTLVFVRPKGIYLVVILKQLYDGSPNFYLRSYFVSSGSFSVFHLLEHDFYFGMCIYLGSVSSYVGVAEKSILLISSFTTPMFHAHYLLHRFFVC